MKGIDRGVFLRWIPISYFGSLACSDIYHGHIWGSLPASRIFEINLRDG